MKPSSTGTCVEADLHKAIRHCGEMPTLSSAERGVDAATAEPNSRSNPPPSLWRSLRTRNVTVTERTPEEWVIRRGRKSEIVNR